MSTSASGTPTRASATAASYTPPASEVARADDENRAVKTCHLDGAIYTRGSDVIDRVGSIYDGNVGWELPKDGKAAAVELAQGHGTLTLRDGSKYVGEFLQGERHGNGVWFEQGEHGETVYRGDWRNDMTSGWGRLTYADGRYYEGYWIDGLPHGRGEMRDDNGDKYVGEFAYDKWHGTGKLYGPDGVLKRAGEWRESVEYEPKPKPAAKMRDYKYDGRVTLEGSNYVLVAKEDEALPRIAKELDHGCTLEDLIELNKPNFEYIKNSKFRAGTRVWLPPVACGAYLCAAKVAKAEAAADAKVAKAHAEADAAKVQAARAKAEAEALKEEAEALIAEQAKQATTEATTAAAGPKHQPRVLPRTPAEADDGDEAAAAVDQARVDAALAAVPAHESRLVAIDAERTTAYSQITAAAQAQDVEQIQSLTATVTRLNAEKAAVEATLSKKRALESAMGPYTEALEAVRVKRDRVAAARNELRETEAACTQAAAAVSTELERLSGGGSQ